MYKIHSTKTRRDTIGRCLLNGFTGVSHGGGVSCVNEGDRVSTGSGGGTSPLIGKMALYKNNIKSPAEGGTSFVGETLSRWRPVPLKPRQ